MKKILLTAIFLFPFLSFAQSLPSFPMAFYGNATLNNSQAPAGTIIRAYYGNTLAGQATVDSTGAYGYASSTASKLLIGSSTGPITFTFQTASILSGQESAGNNSVSYSGFQEGVSLLDNLNFTYTVPVVSHGCGGGSGGYFPVVSAPAASTTLGTTTITAPLTGSSTPPAFAFSFDLKQGMSGNEIIQLQKILTADGSYTGPVTGYFGPLTLSAVKVYQVKNNLPSTGFDGNNPDGSPQQDK